MSIKDLKELHELMQQGVLTQEEFEAQKKIILGNRTQPGKAAPHTSLFETFAKIKLQNMLPVILTTGAFILFSAVFLILANANSESFMLRFSLILSIAAFVGSAFLQSIVHYRAWKALPPERQIVAPDKAVLFLLIPVLSLYWVFPSFYSLAKQTNQYRIERGLGFKRFNEELFLLFGILTVTCFIALATLDLRFMGLSLRVFAYNYETLFYFLLFWSLAGLYITYQESGFVSSAAEHPPAALSESKSADVARSTTGVKTAGTFTNLGSDVMDIFGNRNIVLLIGIAIALLVLGLFWFIPTTNPVHSIARILFFVYGVLLVVRRQWAPVTLILAALTGIVTTFYYLIARNFTDLDPEEYRMADTLIVPAGQILWLALFHKPDIASEGVVGVREKLRVFLAQTNWKRIAFRVAVVLVLAGGVYSLITFVNWRSNYLRLNAYARITSKDGMSFRLGPSINDKSMQIIKKGQFVYVSGQNSEDTSVYGIKSKWYMIEYRGKRGWMWGGLAENEDVSEPNAIADKGEIPKLARIQPKEVTASGWLDAPSPKYHPSLVADGKTETTWADARRNAPGIGEWLNVAFTEPTRVNAVGIVNGLHRPSANGYQDAYLLNSSPKKIQLEFDKGYTQTILLDRSREMQFFTIPTQDNVASIKLTILSEYPGQAYQDTCISELAFYK